MEKTINVGVVGCGYWGPKLIRNLRQTDCRVELVCDSDDRRLSEMRSLYPDIETTNSFSRLVEDARIDAVVIATPAELHFEMARACLMADKHVLVEKPMTRTVDEAQRLVDLAGRRSRVLMVDHTFLFAPAVRYLKKMLYAGGFGELRHIHTSRLNLGLFQNSLNVAWDLAPHDISIVLHLFGEMPVSVSCQGSSHVIPGIEDITSMYLQFPGDRSALIHSSWLDPVKTRTVTVVGSRRMGVYDDGAPVDKLRIYDTYVDAVDGRYHYHSGGGWTPCLGSDEPLKLECQHFLECIKSGQTPIASGWNGLDVVRVLQAAETSLRDGDEASVLI